MAVEREGKKRTREEAASLVIADCRVCGQPFGQEQAWMTTCMPCFKEAKGYGLYGSDVGYVALQAEVVRLRKKVSDAPKAGASTSAGDSLTADLITRLLLLCHPDKHANSETSNEVTRWLIEIRKKMKR